MTVEEKKSAWKGPTVKAIAEMAGVGSATVDRVLNQRSGVSKKTRERVLHALDTLSGGQPDADGPLRLHLFCDSGSGFNSAMSCAEAETHCSLPDVQIHGHYIETHEMEPQAFADSIEAAGTEADGIILVAPDYPAINRAVRNLVDQGTPVVCLTTDLPNSGRSAYIGNDQHAAGSVAAHLIGKALPPERNRILLVMSVPFRSQQEREMGFRSVLRSDFPHLLIEERVVSDDLHEHTYELVSKYIEARGLPAAIYNVAGANRGVARALQQNGQAQNTLFIGHELTVFSQELLEQRRMDYVISHDFSNELQTAIGWIRQSLAGTASTNPPNTPILIHTRFNCGL
ncbi:MAG: LacI family DNA-binding transcriptional regulator [Thiolinea sp.]